MTGQLQVPATGPGAGYDIALGKLRAFVVFLVVVHHSVLAYFPDIPPPAAGFPVEGTPWRAFPVLDPSRWPLTPLVAAFDDVFFMALLFLLSGLLVSESVARRGLVPYLRGRVRRLAIPFLVVVVILMPLAYYPTWLQAGEPPDLARYWHAWRTLEDWPTGPAWFVLLLLAYDVVAGLLFLVVPDWARVLGRLVAGTRVRPARLYAKLFLASLIAYAPLALAYGTDTWTHLGLRQFQTSRVLHYFVYFALGVGIGAAGLRERPLAADGALAERWLPWTLAMLVAFTGAAALFVAELGARGSSREVLRGLGTIGFALSCAASTFAFLALFGRFAHRPSALARAAADDSYAIYLVHYPFVTWTQYALLGAALTGGVKAALVVVVAYALSFGVAALLRTIPLVARHV